MANATRFAEVLDETGPSIMLCSQHKSYAMKHGMRYELFLQWKLQNIKERNRRYTKRETFLTYGLEGWIEIKYQYYQKNWQIQHGPNQNSKDFLLKSIKSDANIHMEEQDALSS